MNIGIIGYGYVGEAVAESYRFTDLTVCDVAPAALEKAAKQVLGVANPCGMVRRVVGDVRDMATYQGVYRRYDAVFVCVPTPARPDGSCDDSVLVSVVKEVIALGLTDTIICKSTAPVETYRGFPKSVVAFAPEFLRQASSVLDYLNQKRIVIGVDESELAQRCVQVFRKAFRTEEIRCISRDAAVMVKYTHNVSLAVKVAAMNECHLLAQHYGVRWDEVQRGLERTVVGNSHTQVPGPDGKAGFGGACFPKDMHAFLHMVKGVAGTHFNTIQAAMGWCQPDADPAPLAFKPVASGTLPDAFSEFTPADSHGALVTEGITVEAALKVLSAAFAADPGYLWTWQSDVAVAFQDAVARDPEASIHEASNRAAAQFLKSAFDVDVTGQQEFTYFEAHWAEQGRNKDRIYPDPKALESLHGSMPPLTWTDAPDWADSLGQFQVAGFDRVASVAGMGDDFARKLFIWYSSLGDQYEYVFHEDGVRFDFGDGVGQWPRDSVLRVARRPDGALHDDTQRLDFLERLLISLDGEKLVVHAVPRQSDDEHSRKFRVDYRLRGCDYSVRNVQSLRTLLDELKENPRKYGWDYINQLLDQLLETK